MKIEDMFAKVGAFDEIQGQMTDTEMAVYLLKRRLEAAEAVCARLFALKRSRGDDAADTLSGLGTGPSADALLDEWHDEVVRQESA